MSRRQLPWYRTYGELHANEDYTVMTLEQQAVYRNLLDYASLQTPRGTFQTRNLPVLANHVSAGRVDVLTDVIDYCSSAWVGADGTPHVVIEGGRGRFTTFSRHQRPPSDGPERIRERQDRYKERHNVPKTDESPLNNGQITDDSRTNNGTVEVEGEIDAAAVTTNSNARACEEEDEAAAVLTVLGVEPGGDDAEIVREAIRSHPDQPHLLKARECKTDDWRSLSPRRRASRYHNWLLGARRIQEEQSASRAPPGNGAPAPAADHFLPDDPDEMARIQREYEVRENRATERRNRSSLGSASRTGGAGQRPDRTGRDEPPG